MTETTVTAEKLPEALQRFILHWGDMGGQWGVNRSVSQIHALLYLSAEPLTAEDIAEKLGLARSNVSNSIKELQNWELVRRLPVMGDRRDFFAAETDVWTMAAKIAAGRKQREIDPALAALAACVEAADGDSTVDPVAVARLKEMLAFTQTVANWYEQMAKVPRPSLMLLIRLGNKIINLLPVKKAK
jgi:DNA-binding transcriptional regulator GbsR (MarR family)